MMGKHKPSTSLNIPQTTSDKLIKPQDVTLADFNIIKRLGIGGFGTVY